MTYRHDVKLHALVGTKTNVIGAATVTGRDRNDYTQFTPLAKESAQTVGPEAVHPVQVERER